MSTQWRPSSTPSSDKLNQHCSRYIRSMVSISMGGRPRFPVEESFSDIEYSCRKKKTRREEFLEIMDDIIPWDEWVSLIVPHYPSLHFLWNWVR